MENIAEDFLKVSLDGYGSGNGYGDGYGYGNGNGSGNGYSNGYGYDDGSGNGYSNGNGSGNGYSNGYGYDDGSGDGSGYGDGYSDVKALNGLHVYMIDNMPTLVTSLHNNIAQGYILRRDLTLKPCYIAKINQYYAHGKTAKKAVAAVRSKYNINKPLEERLAEFNKAYPDREKPVPAKELYNWHHILTGSCEFGRQEFCKDHKININTDLLTVNEFIALTVNEYGGNIIKQL